MTPYKLFLYMKEIVDYIIEKFRIDSSSDLKNHDEFEFNNGLIIHIPFTVILPEYSTEVEIVKIEHQNDLEYDDKGRYIFYQKDGKIVVKLSGSMGVRNLFKNNERNDKTACRPKIYFTEKGEINKCAWIKVKDLDKVIIKDIKR